MTERMQAESYAYGLLIQTRKNKEIYLLIAFEYSVNKLCFQNFENSLPDYFQL